MKKPNEEFDPKAMGDLFKKLGEHLEATKNVRIDEDIEYPVQVDKLDVFALRPEDKREEVGGWVAVRPCNEKYENKTFLGVYLGDLAVGSMTTYNPDDKSMGFIVKRNPAMFVPEIKKVIYGMESWWSNIDTPEDLKKITDQDIQNVWYVKALKEMTSEKAD